MQWLTVSFITKVLFISIAGIHFFVWIVNSTYIMFTRTLVMAAKYKLCPSGHLLWPQNMHYVHPDTCYGHKIRIMSTLTLVIVAKYALCLHGHFLWPQNMHYVHPDTCYGRNICIMSTWTLVMAAKYALCLLGHLLWQNKLFFIILYSTFLSTKLYCLYKTLVYIFAFGEITTVLLRKKPLYSWERKISNFGKCWRHSKLPRAILGLKLRKLVLNAANIYLTVEVKVTKYKYIDRSFMDGHTKPNSYHPDMKKALKH